MHPEYQEYLKRQAEREAREGRLIFESPAPLARELKQDMSRLEVAEENFVLNDKSKAFIFENLLQVDVPENRKKMLFNFIENWAASKHFEVINKSQ